MASLIAPVTMNVDFNPQLRLQILKTLLKRTRFHMFITSWGDKKYRNFIACRQILSFQWILPVSYSKNTCLLVLGLKKLMKLY